MSSELPDPDYRQVFHLAPAPLVLLTPDFTVVDVNRARLETTATTREASVGRKSVRRPPRRSGGPAPRGAGRSPAVPRARS